MKEYLPLPVPKLPRAFAACVEHLPEALSHITMDGTQTVHTRVSSIHPSDARFHCKRGCMKPVVFFFQNI